jgi:hypothetical protein
MDRDERDTHSDNRDQPDEGLPELIRCLLVGVLALAIKVREGD